MSMNLRDVLHRLITSGQSFLEHEKEEAKKAVDAELPHLVPEAEKLAEDLVKDETNGTF
jgi:F0F1-type ATP synthase membrane subunit b/b'